MTDTTASDPRYITCADTAKLIRAALRKAFPGTKFGVRSHSYSGGASINVDWIDGPTSADVEAIAKQFAGGRFDGSIDMAYSVRHWLLPDGTADIAHSPGTTSSLGADQAVSAPAPDGAELVRFGADYVHVSRRYSGGTMSVALEELGRRWPEIAAEKPEIRCGQLSAYIARDFLVKEAGDWAAVLLQQHMHAKDLRPKPKA